MTKRIFVRSCFTLLWLFAWFAPLISWGQPTFLAEIPQVDGQPLTVSFDPNRNMVELKPLNLPRYEILTNGAGRLHISIQRVFLQSDQIQSVRVEVGPISLIQFQPSRQGVDLIFDWQQQPVVEHTRNSIRLLFDEASSPTETPSLTPPTPSYELTTTSIQVGDRLTILVFWEAGFLRSDDVPVALDGTITYRELGTFAVNGMTVHTLQQQLQQRLARYLRQFSVALHRRPHATPAVTIVGERSQSSGGAKAGQYAWYPRMGLKELVQMAGGWTSQADLKRVAVYRKKSGDYERQVIDLAALLNQSSDFTLISGDIVHIPAVRQASQIGIFGLVKREGNQPLGPSDQLSTAIRNAGGPTLSGQGVLWVSVLRQNGEQLQFAYDTLKQNQDLSLKHGDVIYLHAQMPQR